MRTPKALILTVAAAMMIAGCNKNGGDDTLATDIKAKFFSDPDLKSASIDVQVKGGEVTLSGNLPNAEAQLKAYKLANETPGVKKVVDQMAVGPAGAPPNPTVAGNGSEPRHHEPRESPSGAPAGRPLDLPKNNEPPQPVAVEIPSGTTFEVRMIDSIDSAKNTAGQTFRASLDAPVVVDGREVLPRGTDVTVRLAAAKSAGRVAGKADLELQLAAVQFNGQSYPITSNVYEERGKSRGKQSAERIGIGAAVGAAIGAIAGGGKGAGIGAAVGGGGATAYQVFTRGQQVRVPSETRLSFKLQAPVTVR